MNITIFSTDRNSFIYLLKKIENEKIELENIFLLSISDLENKEFSYKNKILKVSNINNFRNYSSVSLAIFDVNDELTKKFVYNFIENNCIVIDNSNYFKNDESIPMINCDINIYDIKNFQNKNIISIPTSSTIQLVNSINPLYDLGEIKNIIVSTYQSVSMLGKNAMDELYNHTKKIYENEFLQPVNFKKQITFNVLPQIGEVSNDNYYKEENLLINEANKILNKNIKINATCALVPTFNGNCQSVHIEFDRDINIEDVFDIYENCDDISFLDRFDEYNFATPKEVSLEENVYISRVRKDVNNTNCINIWSVIDNLTVKYNNIVEIIKTLKKEYKIGD